MGGSFAWVLGVMLAVTASVISNLGLNLQKRAHLALEAKKAASHHGHHHHKERGDHATVRRNRTASTAASPAANSAVSFGPLSTTNAETPDSPKPVNPLSPSGILKKKSGVDGAYALMDESMEDEDALVRRDEARKAEQQQTQSERRKQYSQTLGNSATRRGDDKYTSQYEQAHDGVNLDLFSKPLPPSASHARRTSNGHISFAADSNSPTTSSTPRTRARSMSAAGTRRAVGHGSRTSRRRSSLGMDQAAVTAAGATGGAAKEKHYTRQPLWVGGIVCVILGSLFDFAALAFVDQSVVAPLGSLTLVSNVFFAPLLLKEKVNRKQLYCTALIISGSILAVAFAPHAGADPNIKGMFANFARPRFIVYGLLSTLMVAGLCYASWRLNKIRRQDLHAYQLVAKYHTFCYASCAGIMGAQSVLFAKCTAMLLASTFSGDGLMFVYWGTYFVLLGLGVTIFLQIRWLNSGLQRFSALMIVPIFQSFWILVSVIAGMVFFGEYEGIFSHPANAALFPLGLALTICGVYFLTRIAPPGQTEGSAQHAPLAAGSAEASDAAHEHVGRRRSRTTLSSGSLSPSLIPGGASTHGESSIPGGPAIVTRSGDSTGAVAIHSSVQGRALSPSALQGDSSSPLLASNVRDVGEHYGVPQSPRVPSDRRVAPAPGTTGGKPGIASSSELDRAADAGSYSDTTSDSLLARTTSDGSDDLRASAAAEEDEDGEDDEEGSVSGSDREDSPEMPTSTYHTLMMHSLAPINFLMTSLIPTRLMEESASPGSHRHSYFEENSSGFNDVDSGSGGGSSGGLNGGDGASGLPYASIFRVREEHGDEENPTSPQGPNVFASPTTSPRIASPSTQHLERGARLGRLPLHSSFDRPDSPSNNGASRQQSNWHAPSPISTSRPATSVQNGHEAASSADAASPSSPRRTAGSPMDVPVSSSASSAGGLPSSASSVGMFDPSLPTNSPQFLNGALTGGGGDGGAGLSVSSSPSGAEEPTDSQPNSAALPGAAKKKSKGKKKKAIGGGMAANGSGDSLL